MEEKRRSKRLELKVNIQLERVDEPGGLTTVQYVSVDVTDLSRGGIGFTTGQELKEHTYYDTELEIWTKEKIDTVIEIVRAVRREDGIFEYGASFIGMTEAEALKIDIYRLLQESQGKL